MVGFTDPRMIGPFGSLSEVLSSDMVPVFRPSTGEWVLVAATNLPGGGGVGPGGGLFTTGGESEDTVISIFGGGESEDTVTSVFGGGEAEDTVVN